MKIKTTHIETLAILFIVIQFQLISAQSPKLSKIRTRGKWFVDEVIKIFLFSIVFEHLRFY
jgi:hypothetical protein